MSDLKLVVASTWRGEAGRCRARAEVGKKVTQCSGRGSGSGEEGTRSAGRGSREQRVVMDPLPRRDRLLEGVTGRRGWN